MGPKLCTCFRSIRPCLAISRLALKVDAIAERMVNGSSMSGGRKLCRVAQSGICPIMLRSRASASRSEEHTSELQSLMRISYAVFCLKKKQHITYTVTHTRSHINQNTQIYQ